MTTSLPTGSRLLPGDDGPFVRVGSALLEEASEALMSGPDELRRDQARRFLEYAAANAIDLRAMWARLDEAGQCRATVLIVPNPGRTAMVFVTPPRRGGDVDELASLVDHACGCFAGGEADLAPVDLVQVLVEPEDRLERRLFEAAGFHVLARLSYLQRPLPGPRVPDATPWPTGVRIVPYAEQHRSWMLEVLEASYEQTLDCPGLRGLRRTEDVLRGHQATGQFDPSLWTLLVMRGRPVGALLLNPSAQGRSIELVYLGLARSARGLGLGRRLLHHGLRLVRSRSERLITLAVDDDNAPAIQLYRSEGFRRRLRRLALIRSLRVS